MDLWPYLQSLLNHWWALMGCAFFTIMGFIGLAVNRERTWNLRVGFIGAFVMLLFASYQAWGDQYRDFQELQKKLSSPEFNFEIASYFSDNGKDLEIIVSGILTNPFGPSSAAYRWRARLEFPSRTVIGEVPPPPQDDERVPMGRTHVTGVLRAKDSLVAQQGAPIQAGAGQPGWLKAVFRNVTTNDIYKDHPTLVISCEDIATQKHHEFRSTLGTQPPRLYIPGLMAPN